MKKYCLSILYFILTSLTYCTGQSVQVKYSFFTNPGDAFLGLVEFHKLTLVPVSSEYVLIDRKFLKQFNSSEKTEEDGLKQEKLGGVIRVLGKIKPKFLIKKYASNTMLSNDHIGRNEYIIKENIDLMNWDISPKDTIFFEKKCKIATTQHRGQKWTVFFTDAFGVTGGPWKFDGLPGLIVYAQNETKQYIFQATELTVSKETNLTVTPTQDKTVVSWTEYITLRKEHDLNKLKRMKSASASAPSAIGGNDIMTIKFTYPLIEDIGYNELSR